MHICCWSGGKDSTASVILAHEHNEPLDLILMSEVMFDKANGISGEHPRHIDFVRNVAKPKFESWGYKVKIVHSDTDYLDCFYHVIENPRVHKEHAGMKYGFPLTGACVIQRDCKLRPIHQYLNTIDEPVVQYLGICADEPKRLASMHKDASTVSLLEKYGVTQAMAPEICKSYGLYSPGYELSKRQGCFFCPNASMKEHEALRNDNPELWQRLLALEDEANLANPKWSVYKETLKERDKALYWKSRQMSLFDFIDS